MPWWVLTLLKEPSWRKSWLKPVTSRLRFWRDDDNLSLLIKNPSRKHQQVPSIPTTRQAFKSKNDQRQWKPTWRLGVLSRKTKTRIGFWNVGAMFGSGRLEQVTRKMNENNKFCILGTRQWMQVDFVRRGNGFVKQIYFQGASNGLCEHIRAREQCVCFCEQQAQFRTC